MERLRREAKEGGDKDEYVRPEVDKLEILQMMKENEKKLNKAELEHQLRMEQQENAKEPPPKNTENFIQKGLDEAADNTEDKKA